MAIEAQGELFMWLYFPSRLQALLLNAQLCLGVQQVSITLFYTTCQVLLGPQAATP